MISTIYVRERSLRAHSLSLSLSCSLSLPFYLSRAEGLSRSHRVGFYKYWAAFFFITAYFPASCCYCCCRCCSYSYVSIGRLFSLLSSPSLPLCPSPSAVIRCRLGLVFVAFLDKRLLHSAFNYQRVDKSSSSLSPPSSVSPCVVILCCQAEIFQRFQIYSQRVQRPRQLHVFFGAAFGSFNCSISANWCRPDGAASGHVK